MGRKAKISYEIKFKFIEEYLNGNISQIAISRELGLHPSSIQGWIRKYTLIIVLSSSLVQLKIILMEKVH